MKIINKFYATSSLVLALISNAHAVLPIFPAEILGRELQIPGLGWAGHVGIATAPNLYQDAYQVLEVLKDDRHPIQLNTIADFKTRTKYWGSRYGVADRGNGALKILREANFQRDLDCTDYTVLAGYEPSTGYYDSLGKAHCTSRGQFRCDTFVYYLFQWGGYNLPVSTIINPKRVFNSFPYGNGDGPYAPENRFSASRKSEKIGIAYYNISDVELSAMPYDEFYSLINRLEKPNKASSERLLRHTIANELDIEKTNLVLERFGGVGDALSISQIINSFDAYGDMNGYAYKSRAILTMQRLFDLNKCIDSKSDACINAEENLEKFYWKVINERMKIAPNSITVVVRGYLNMAQQDKVLRNHDVINNYIEDKSSDLDPRSRILLKMELLDSAKDLEQVYLPEIIQILNTEMDPDLSGTFNRYAIAKLSRNPKNSFSNKSMELIKEHLELTRSQHDLNNRQALFLIPPKTPGMFDYGSWLELFSLVNSDSPENASKMIDHYIGELQTNDEKLQYVVGLSNSDYMQQAFINQPNLSDIKNKNPDFYTNTVGSPTRDRW